MDESCRIIPLDKAHQILVTFGITKPTQVYEWRVRADGFRSLDLYEVLGDSRFFFGMDWHGLLSEFVEEVLPSLAELGCVLTYEPDDDQGNSGNLSSGDGRSEHIRYIPNEPDEFDDVIRAMQRLSGKGVEFRQSPTNDGRDTWIYAALLADEWKELEAIDRTFILSYFVPFYTS